LTTVVDPLVDPRNAVFQFMVAAAPHDALVAEILGLILKNCGQMRENATS
jgi:hypothetical protein